MIAIPSFNEPDLIPDDFRDIINNREPVFKMQIAYHGWPELQSQSPPDDLNSWEIHPLQEESTIVREQLVPNVYYLQRAVYQ